MDVPSSELYCENLTDTCPLLMERSENFSEHIIDIPRGGDASSSNLSHETTSNGLDVLQREDRPSTSARVVVSQPSASSSNGTNLRTSSAVRRGDARRRRSPLNSGLWISIELVLTVSQIVASIIVLSLSRNEHPHTPLFLWIVGYAAGCVATLPLLYWRHRNQASEQDSAQHRQTSHSNVPAGPFSFSVTRTSDGGDHRTATTSPRGGQNMGVTSSRIKVLVEYLKMALDCFFAVWFVVGNVWIFGGHSSASEAPNMYRLCIVFLTFSCIGYAMPFILCATICCCLPCIISVLGFREDLSQARGATSESIDALPTYKFKVKKSRNGDGRDTNSGAGEGGVVAAGTEKERVISGEDAVCCICLAKYANNDELRELPCCHFMHKECVDKWLKINASCPLCKSEVGENVLDAISGTSTSILSSLSGAHDNQRRAAYSLMIFLLMCWVVVPSILYGCLTSMSDNLVCQQLSIPGNQMAQMEPITNKLDASMSMELMCFGTNESLQQQPIGQVESGSNDRGPRISSMSNQQGEHIGSQAYIQLSQHYLMTNQPVGDIIPSMLDSPKPHQFLTLNKRKAPMEPISPNSAPQKLLFQNKRVAQMEHRPLLQPISAPGKRTVQMQSVSNSPGSQPSPSSNKRLAPNKSGSSASRNQPAQMRSLAKVQAESSESVRSKMRESLAGALSLVSQQRNENAMVDKNSNHEAASSPRKTKEDSCTIDSNSVISDVAHSISAEPQGLSLSNRDGSTDGNSSDVPQRMQRDEQQLESSNLLPDEEDVPFSDNIFARDELLQGNGLSWVLEPETDAAKEKEIDTVDNGKVGKEDVEQSLLSPQELACQIEAELFKLFGGVNKKYKEKGRSLLFNLKDRNNPELRERVVSGEIPPERLCSMSAEELASKELSQWRQAKAEELAQMVVLPDVEVDIRRLVRKTHKGEFQVEAEPTDSASVEVSAGTSISQRPKAEVQQAPTNGKTDGKKDESNSAGEKSNLEDPNLTITIPSSEGPDPMQGLMGEDEMKDTDFLPPIVSLDEFMQSLDSEPPFENLPGDAGKATSISDKGDTESGSDSKSSGRATQDPVDTVHDKPGSIDASNPKPDSDVKLNDIPAKTETIASAANLKAEHVWEGTLQLTITVLTSVICFFKSGEKTSTENWSSSLEIKGRVRLDAFEKFLQELPMSRSRAVMVVHFVCEEGSTESDRGSLVEAADSYIMDGRVGFAEAASGVELYFCPPHAKTLEMLTKILPKNQLEALNAIDNGLIGVVVWRKAHLISPNSTSHHKHTSKRQHSISRRHQEKDATNMNTNFPSKPTFSHAAPLHSKPPPDDDDNDDVPPRDLALPLPGTKMTYLSLTSLVAQSLRGHNTPSE
ncbi:hypothetical protein PTKIN_Ptkin03bG0149200 [Pterospermum kingtungense]